MVASHAAQPVISAFSFGIITNGAAAAAVVFLRSSASSLFHDSQRLALIIFLISAALWALIAFIGLALENPSGCQVAIVFTTAFDQIARTAFAQFLLWAMTEGSKRSWATFIPQTLVVLRFVLGGVYVGFQRPQFAPVCFSSTDVLPLGASILGIDAIILSILLITFRTGSSNGNGRLQVNAYRAKVLLLGVAAAAFWTVLSGPMLLGIRSLNLLLRTVLPCIGLVVLISMTVLAKSQLLANADEKDKLYPNLDGTRQYRMSDLVRDMATRPSLQMSVARPDSKVSKRESQSVRLTALNKPPNPNKALPGINGPVPGQVETGIGGLPIAGQLFPPTKSGNPVDSRYIQPQGSPKSRDGYKRAEYAKTSGQLISGPVLREDSPNPLDKVATVDLMTAARRDQERRAVHTRPRKSRTSGAASPATTANQWTSRSRDSGVPSATRTHLDPVVESAVTSSAQPSPGLDDLRRRSPRLTQHIAFQQTRIAPLKTRGTVSAGKADVWDLLAVPNGEPPVVPPRSPLRQQQQPWTSPAAKAIATMPSAPSERQRSQSKQHRAARSKDLKIDTSSQLQPASNNNNDSYAFAQRKRSEAPPPYQIDYQARRSPKTPALEAFVAPPAIVETRSSPRLSLFPPPPTKKAISPRQDSPTARDVSLAPGKPITYKGLEALPHTDGTFTTQTVLLLDDVEYRDSIMTTLIASRQSSPIRESVLDRPRPVTRTPEAAHFLHAHGRSQSCGSVLTRESSLFQKTAGDPSSLPPLPPIPISKSPLFNGLLGHAKSATVDERLGRTGVGRRRSRSLTANVPTTIPLVSSSMSTVKTDSLLGMADLTGLRDQEARIQEPPATNTLENVALETSPVPSLRGTATPDEELSETSSFDTGVAESPFLDQYSPPITPRQHNFSPPESPAKMEASKTMLDNDMWRRLGAPCPTFSNRPAFSRRQPPPEPLPLFSSVNTVVVETEPSPLESPDHALREIEAQLQKLERSSRVSSVDQMQRMTLLAELEQEIEGQETQWQAMRHTIIRDSMSTVGVSPHRAKEVGSLWAKLRRDRDSHLTVDTCLSARSASPEPLRRLAVPGSRMSHLALSPLQLGSPTPPDTDSDMGDEIPVMMLAQAVQLARRPAVSLWRAEAASPLMFKYTASLWSPSQDRSLVLPEVLPVPTAKPARRYKGSPLEIDSQQLWTKAKKYTSIRRGGLWKPTSPVASTASPSSAATTPLPALAPLKRSASLPSRPSLAVKPIRKPKRISALPDIVESPRLHPVRHTLGLFSFPWGETSDSAYPALYQNAIPGTMSTGMERVFDFPTAAAPQGDAQRTFFEECDEEDYGDNFEDMDDYDGFGSEDDEVDQEMLWEIASMLKGEDFHLVPSGVQLPSQWPREAPESNAHVQSAIDEAISEPMVAPTAKAELWQPASHLFKVVKKQVGLEQPDQGAWQSYVDVATVETGARRRLERESLFDDVHGRLWMPRHDADQQLPHGPTLWTSADRSRASSPSCSIDSASEASSQTEGQPTSDQLIQTPRALWSLPQSTQPQTPAAQIASLWVSPLSLPPSSPEDLRARSSTSHATRRHKRTLPATLPQISTCALWLPEQETVASPDWMVRHTTKSKASSSKLWSRVDQSAKPKPSSSGLWLPHALPPPPEEKFALQPRSNRRPTMTQTPSQLSSDQLPGTLWLPKQENVNRPDWMVHHTTKSKAPSSKLWRRVEQQAKPSSDGLWLPHVLPPPEEECTLQPRSSRRPVIIQTPMENFSEQASTLWLPEQQKATIRLDWMARHTANSTHSQPAQATWSKLWSRVDQPAKPSSDRLWVPHVLPSHEEEYTLQPRSNRHRPAMTHAPLAHFNHQVPCTLWLPAQEVNRPDWMARHITKSNHSQHSHAPWAKLWRRVSQPHAAKPSSDGLWLLQASPSLEEEYTLQPRSSHRRPAMTKAPMARFSNQGLWTSVRCSGEGTRGWLI